MSRRHRSRSLPSSAQAIASDQEILDDFAKYEYFDDEFTDDESTSQYHDPKLAEQPQEQHRHSIDMFTANEYIDDTDSDKPVDRTQRINMWAIHTIGLYASYFALGLVVSVFGRPTQSACRADGYFTRNRFENTPQGQKALNALCNYITVVGQVPWSFKLFFAFFTDLVWPFGMRRKPYFVVGWLVILLCLGIAAILVEDMTHEDYLCVLLITNVCLQIAMVPADGYAVQLALMNKEGPRWRRGYILNTCFMSRFLGSALGSFIHGFLMNGPELNRGPNGTPPVFAWDQTWEWGISLQEYYILAFILVLPSFVLILKLQEIPDPRPCAQRRSPMMLMRELAEVLKSKATFNLIIFALFAQLSTLSHPGIRATQGPILNVPILQNGVEGTLSYLAMVIAIMCYRDQLVHENWKKLNLIARVLTQLTTAALWSMAFYNFLGLRFGWFTVFAEVNVAFIEALTFLAIPNAALEIATPGIETSVYQIFISVTNGASFMAVAPGSILFNALVPDKLPTSSVREFDYAGGPWYYTRFTIVWLFVTSLLIVVACRFMPEKRETFRTWGSIRGAWMGLTSVILSVTVLTFSFAFLYALTVPDLSCMVLFGGRGCEDEPGYD
jgi:hypothetical protein